MIAGDGPDAAALEQHAGTLALRDAVRFTGLVPHEDLPELYRQASVFVLPSEREGMPNAQLEAMASGLPVVTTVDSDDLLDQNGVRVTPGDAPGIAEALTRYGLDPELRREHGLRSRELAEAKSWTVVAEWYLRIYRSLIGRADVSPMP